MRTITWSLAAVATMAISTFGHTAQKASAVEFPLFMRQCTDYRQRLETWGTYQKAIVEASSLAKWDNWFTITEVSCHSGSGASWTGISNRTAKLDLPDDPNDIGAMFHELGHGFFNGSPLHRSKQNAGWSEAFVDAFRYFMEARWSSTSPWYGAAEASLTRGDWSVAVPEHRPSMIVAYCERDYEKFRKLWAERNARSDEDLQAFFQKAFPDKK